MFNIQFLKKGRKYINDSLLTGLISYWKLNEASGTRADSAGSNDLTDNNTVPRVVGKQSGAANFTAANSEYLSIASNDSLNTGDSDFTYAGWVNLRAKNLLDFQILLSKRDGPSNQRQITIDFDRVADRFRASISSDGTTSTTVSANNFGSPTIATWYFFMVWYDAAADTINMSINNGTADSAAHSGGAYTGTGPFCLAAGNSTANTFLDGYLDEVGFWKRLLTTEEKTRLYNSGNGITYPFNSILDRLVSYWAMEQTSGNRTDSNLATTLVDNNSVTYGNGIIRNGAQFTLANSEYLSTVSNDTALFSFGDTDYTIAAWVYLDSKATSQLFASKYSSDSVRDFILQYVTGSDFFRFIVYDGGSTIIGNVSSSAGVNTGAWYFIVAYHDATNNLVGVSVNGGAPTTAATTGTAASTASLFYVSGREGGSTFQYFDGKVDEYGVWRRVLSAAEIAYLYNNGRGKTYPLSNPMSQI